jgi:hypothetical protein
MTGPLSETRGNWDLRLCADSLGPLSPTSRSGSRTLRTPLCSDLERAAAECISLSAWLSPFLLENPGLYQMIADLPTGGNGPSEDVTVVLNTALLLVGKYTVPRQADRENRASTFRVLGMDIRILVDRRSASLLLTEKPGLDNTWKIVATTNDGEEALQSETVFWQKRTNRLQSAFLLLKRFHAENKYDHPCSRRK